ncbi:pentatricopeptide repeat-containing protein At5g43790-like [Asparagus officinalis]|nr:pentatricopeptide repeat-containing protein At5g43790-like [Asparagus officinalis]
MFDEIHLPDLAAWNSVLSALSHCSYVETLLLFRRMLEDSRVNPNEITLVAVVSACGDLGALAQGFWAHSYILRGDCLSINRFVGTSLVEMYSKCGRLDFAEQVFGELSKRDVTCYNAMIRGFAIHGFGHRAIVLFERMITEGVRVDEVTVLVLMSACAHSGLVDEGRHLFNRMQKDFGIEPKEEHYGCLIDLLGRAGKLKEAENVVRKMSIKPTAAVYRSLLGACRVHGDIKFGERLIARVMQLDPGYGGNYVLQSNLYADICRWDDVGRVRKVMKAKGIDKTPGLSSIEMDGVVHEFVMGDKGHPRCGDIYDLLDDIGRRLCEYGHRLRANDAVFVV